MKQTFLTIYFSLKKKKIVLTNFHCEIKTFQKLNKITIPRGDLKTKHPFIIVLINSKHRIDHPLRFIPFEARRKTRWINHPSSIGEFLNKPGQSAAVTSYAWCHKHLHVANWRFSHRPAQFSIPPIDPRHCEQADRWAIYHWPPSPWLCWCCVGPTRSRIGKTFLLVVAKDRDNAYLLPGFIAGAMKTHPLFPFRC